MKKTIKTIFVMLALLAGTAEAAVCTSLSNGNWNWSGRWSCGHVPNNTDDVVIAHNITMNTNPDIISLTINAGATLDDNGNDLTVTGSVLIDGTYDGTGNNGNLIMQGNGQTLSGTGTVIDIGRIQIDANTTIPAGSNLNLTLRSEIRVGDQNAATLTIDGTITGTGQNSGNRLIRLDNNNTSNVILNGTINAPNSYVEVQSGGTFTNNGTVTLRNLDGDGAATATWTQGVNSSLTLSQATQSWSGTFNASAVGNTVTWNAPATPLTPSGNTYYNLAGSGVTCPHAFTVLGSDPCVSLPGTATYYHDTTNGVNVGFDGLTNVTGANQTIPPIIRASLNPVSTCPVTRARSNNHPTGLYTHSRWYLNADYLQSTQIGANPSGSASLRGGAVTDTVIVSLYDYDPATGAKALIGSSAPITLTGGGTTTTYLYTISSALYTVPAGHRLMLEYNFNQPVATYNARVYCSATASFISVTETPAPIVPVADYRMDESVAGAAADSSGNGLNGSLNGGVSVGGVGKVCSSYNFNGTNAFVSVPNNALLNRPNVSLSAWVRHTAAAMKSWEAILAKGDTAYRLHLNGGCSINTPNTPNGLSFGINSGCNTADIDSGTVPVASQWYHVVGTYDGTTISIYVDGALTASAAYAGAIGNNTFPLYIGENSQQTGRYWSGDIDEVKIFGTALSATQVATIYANENAGNNWDGSARVCSATGPDHIRVQHDGNGLTCTPETLTVIACANATCTAPHYAGAVAGNVTWGGTPGGAVAFNITTGGMTTVSLPVTTPQTVTLGTGAVSPVPLNASDCVDLSGVTTCNLPFADSGLLVSAPDHVSETAQSLTISAVRKANNALQCVPAFSNVSRTISLNCAYANPGTGTLPVRVAGAALNAANNMASACDATGQTPTLAFDANGTALATLQYADVGQMTINASYAGSAATGDTGLVMTGSDTFIAAPASFAFSGVTAAPIKAGSNFSATVTAYNGHATPTAAPNFGRETTPESVALSFTKCQPTGTSAVNGSFSGSVGTFANGATNATNLNWSEVGNGDLVATLASGSYLGSGLTATGNTGTGGTVCNGAGNVGRFIPDHFDTIVTGPMICPVGLACPAGGLVYSGQSFTANVYARNAAGAITQNYDGTANTTPNFARAVTLEAWDGIGSITTQNPGPGAVTIPAPLVAADFAGGVGVRKDGLGNPISYVAYTFNTTPTAPTDIYMRAVDEDNVSSRLTGIPANSIEGGVKVVSGRMRISDAYGSELLPLPVSATVQYFGAAGAWLTSTTDNATSFNPATNLAVAIVQGPLAAGNISVNNVGAVTVAGGLRSFTLNRPGVTGSANIGLGAGLGAPTYLLGGSNVAGVDPGFPGRVTFGIYKGANEFIYMREAY